jgi:hypothetical protein
MCSPYCCRFCRAVYCFAAPDDLVRLTSRNRDAAALIAGDTASFYDRRYILI